MLKKYAYWSVLEISASRWNVFQSRFLALGVSAGVSIGVCHWCVDVSYRDYPDDPSSIFKKQLTAFSHCENAENIGNYVFLY